MPVSASPCIQYNTEKNVKEVITAMSGIGIARKPQYKFPYASFGASSFLYATLLPLNFI